MDPCFKYWFICVLNCLVKIINFCTRSIFNWTVSYGLNTEYTKSQSNFETSAHMVDVLLFGHYGFFQDVQLYKNFLWKHNRYLHPKYILENDHVTLYGFSKTEVFFCITDPNVDIYNNEIFGFPIVGEKTMCKQLIIMKLEHFHRLAEEIIGDPKVRVGFIHHTSRCGSSLMCQVVNKVPKTRVFVEPVSITDIVRHYYQGIWTKEQTKRCVQNCIRVLCKPVIHKEIQFMLLKWTCNGNILIPMVVDSFPRNKWIFQTRPLLKPALKSMIKSYNSHPWFFRWSDNYFANHFSNHMSFDRTDKKWANICNEVVRNGLGKYTDAERMAAVQGSFLVPYEEVKHAHQMCIFYDDLIKNSKDVIKKVFTTFGLDLKYVDLGLTAFQFDSQRGVTGGTGKTNEIQISDLEYVTIDRIYKQVGLPINSQMTLDELKKVFY